MQFIKTKCVLENKNHKAPGLILFFCKSEKNSTQRKRQFGEQQCIESKMGRDRILADEEGQG